MTIMAVFGPGLATVAMFVLLALVLGLFSPGIGSPRPYLATLASGADQQKWLRSRVSFDRRAQPERKRSRSIIIDCGDLAPAVASQGHGELRLTDWAAPRRFVLAVAARLA